MNKRFNEKSQELARLVLCSVGHCSIYACSPLFLCICYTSPCRHRLKFVRETVALVHYQCSYMLRGYVVWLHRSFCEKCCSFERLSRLHGCYSVVHTVFITFSNQVFIANTLHG